MSTFIPARELAALLCIDEARLLSLAQRARLPFSVSGDGLSIRARDLGAWRHAVANTQCDGDD
jgi:hypothetical protein